jgi:hypothetical protein
MDYTGILMPFRVQTHNGCVSGYIWLVSKYATVSNINDKHRPFNITVFTRSQQMLLAKTGHCLQVCLNLCRECSFW